jgi:tetratricopeptide (TPR) repeat protein
VRSAAVCSPARTSAHAIFSCGCLQAIEADPTDHTFWSNRSACHAELGNWEASAEDARECTTVNRNFVKGYFRWALALQNLGRIDEALDVIKKGLLIDPVNADLKKKRGDIEGLIRERQVNNYLETAQRFANDGDLTNAIKNIESGLRLAPGHPELSRLEARVRPQYEAQEKARLASLNPVERLKEEGDQQYKAANFEAAINAYTRCLAQISDTSSELALKVYANRYVQLWPVAVVVVVAAWWTIAGALTHRRRL